MSEETHSPQILKMTLDFFDLISHCAVWYSMLKKL